MKTVLALRHVGFEDLGTFAPLLEAEGYAIRYLEAGDASLAEADAAANDLVVVLGGPIGVYELVEYPFLERELYFIAQRLAAGRPILGLCLGAQLIAQAAGGRVFGTGKKEIGFAPISLTEAGLASCLAPYAEAPMTLHWHGDTFDLPDGATLLASTGMTLNQAFAMGPNVLGLQFHPEVDTSRIEAWLVGHAAELAGAKIDVPGLRADAATHGAALRETARAVLEGWMKGWV
jgi:GMP synthase (glutamine-hydrolysing)